MNVMSTLPSASDRRDLALAELRVQRLRLQLLVAEIDVIGAGVTSGFIPPDAVPRLLGELFGTHEETGE